MSTPVSGHRIAESLRAEYAPRPTADQDGFLVYNN
jgi:hypothetical protein